MRVREKAVPELSPPAEERKVTTLEYTHLPLGEDVIAFAGYYTPEKEVRLPFHGREIMYVTGHIVIEATCHEGTCATCNYWYVIVPGYIVRWQYRKNEGGLPVSEMEPVANRETQKEIEQIVLDSEAVSRVEFR